MPAGSRRGARRAARALAACALAAAGAGLAVAAARRPGRPPEAVRPETAAGDAACLSCHADKARYEATAHRRTSQAPTAAAFAGSLRPGENELRTPAAHAYYRMHAEAGGFYQTAVVGRGRDTSARTERVAYVFGSGRKGQSYAYWAGERLYQLPVSYWTGLGRWILSPGAGYRDDAPPNFDRPIATRCLECHATWIASVPELDGASRFRRDGAILGVTCERCHGGGREHAARERTALRALRPPRIANPARLDRERQVEACAQCHGGLRAPVAPAFTYVAGRPLGAYLAPGAADPEGRVDVHGNQATLLARSRCYQASRMTCSTCHDVHRPQRDVAELSGRCLTCHATAAAPAPAATAGRTHRALGRAAEGRCVTCHMPLQPSRSVIATPGGRPERVDVRTHWIRVYPAAGAG